MLRRGARARLRHDLPSQNSTSLRWNHTTSEPAAARTRHRRNNDLPPSPPGVGLAVEGRRARSRGRARRAHRAGGGPGHRPVRGARLRVDRTAGAHRPVLGARRAGRATAFPGRRQPALVLRRDDARPGMPVGHAAQRTEARTPDRLRDGAHRRLRAQRADTGKTAARRPRAVRVPESAGGARRCGGSTLRDGDGGRSADAGRLR